MGLLPDLLKRQRLLDRTFIETADGSVTVYDFPDAAGWNVSKYARDEGGEAVKGIRCRFIDGDRRLNLYAKDTVLPYSPASVDALAARNWREYYAPLLARLDALTIVRTTQRAAATSYPALEVTAEGKAQAPQAAAESTAAPPKHVGVIKAPSPSLRIRERFTPVPGHLLVVAAVGTPSLFEHLAPDVERWFASADFDPF